MIAIRRRSGVLGRKVSYGFDVLSSQDVQCPHLSLLEERRKECDGHYGQVLRGVDDRKTDGVSRGVFLKQDKPPGVVSQTNLDYQIIWPLERREDEIGLLLMERRRAEIEFRVGRTWRGERARSAPSELLI